jgi:hypothetical protein
MRQRVCVALMVGAAGAGTVAVVGVSAAAEARPPATGAREPAPARPSGAPSIATTAPAVMHAVPVPPAVRPAAPTTGPQPAPGVSRVARELGSGARLALPAGLAGGVGLPGSLVALRLDVVPGPALGGLGAGDLLGAAVHGPDLGMGAVPNTPAEDMDGGGFSGPVQVPIRPGFSPTGGILPTFTAPSLQALAEGLPDRLPQVEPDVQAGPFALRPLERLGVYLRSLSAAELRDSAAGRDLVVDLPESRTAPQRQETAANRLLRSAVLDVVGEYERLFGPVEAEASGEEAQRIRGAIDAAWRAFGGAEITGAALRRALEGAPEYQECAAYLDGLGRLFEGLRVAGLTATELRAARGVVLAPITPQGMTVQQLERLIATSPAG